MKLCFRAFLGLLITTTLLSACSKDDDIDDVQDDIQHKWSVNNIIFNFENPLGDTTFTYVGIATDYYDFRADGKLYSMVDSNADTVNYSLISNNQLVMDGDTATIHVLTNTQLQVRHIDSTTAGVYNETIANLTR